MQFIYHKNLSKHKIQNEKIKGCVEVTSELEYSEDKLRRQWQGYLSGSDG